MRVEWIGHSTVVIDMDGARLLTDPLLGNRVGPLRRIAQPPSPDALSDVNAVLLSHLHADHLQPSSLRRVAGATMVIAPRGAGSWLRRRGMKDVHEVVAGDSLSVGALSVRVVPATHDGRRGPFGPRAEAVGFVVHGSHGVYFAGDTDIFDGMADLSGSVDLALLPVWGWGPALGPGHLDPERAARAAALIAPRVAVPIHWGTFALPGRLAGKAATDEPAREFVDFARREAPHVEVRLLLPGQSTTLT